jgi:ATP-dependent DNA helicase RecG
MRSQKLNFYFTPISSLKGIGPKFHELYQKLLRKKDDQICYLKDLLFHLPYSLTERILEPESFSQAVGKQVIIKGRILSNNVTGGRYRKILKTNIETDAGFIDLVFYNFNKSYLNSTLKEGERRIIIGQVDRYRDSYQIVHPRVLSINSNETIREKEPVYPQMAGLSNNQILKNIKPVLERMNDLEEWLDASFLKQNNWLSFKDSLKKIHQPESLYDLDYANIYKSRLAYDELLASQLAIGISRSKIQKKDGQVIKSQRRYIKKLLEALEFELTEGQKSALKDVFKDLSDSKRMFRLIQGDVGCGKTIVAAIAMLEAVEAGFQSAFMAPTEILARQQYENLSELLEQTGLNEFIRITLLTGSIKKSQQDKIRAEIKAGNYQFVIGTHSLFQEKVEFHNSGLVVIDEQHRFGVKQRMDLADKGKKTNILLMSATPIPRTLMMTFYGDMEVSTIKDKPIGRQEIETVSVSAGRIEQVISRLQSQIKDDRRVYWVCPLVSDSEEDSDLPSSIASTIDADSDKIASAESRYDSLKVIFGEKVGIVHGKMKANQKEQAINDFKSGKTSILVSTTVIEVGVNIPEATVMIIENAERFGLAQLHQLRGRVGRGSEKSNCVLLYSKKVSDVGRKRLNAMRQTNDGFKIAEEDLVLRGSGDLLGTKQSGLPDFTFAVLPEHKDLLFAARDDTKIILEKDPELKSPRGESLRDLLYLFEYDKQIKNLNA